MNHRKSMLFLAVLVALPFVALASWIAKPLAPRFAAWLEPWYDEILGHFAFFGVENHKSTIVTNSDATPNVNTPALINHGRLREQVATKEIAAADDNGTVVRLFRVWSGWRISSIELGSDALGTGAAYDVGVYDTAAEGGAAVDDNEFADGVDLSGATALTDVTYEAAATEISKIEMALWERLGLTEDPKKWYDIALTGDTAGTSAGTVAARLRYVDGT